MRRLSAGVLLGAVSVGAAVSTGAQQAQTPTFRARTDLIQMDVSVLDGNRMPVLGLSADDFTVLENGVARPVEAFAAVNLPDRVHTGAAWLRDVAPDVVSNRRDAQRVVFILLDDATTRADPSVLKLARTTAATVVGELGPADLAGVIYTSSRRSGQELTTDRARLLAAVERFIPLGPAPAFGGGPFSAGIPSRGLSTPGAGLAGMRGGECPLFRCITDALRNAAEILSAWPGARKTLIMISSYAPDFSEVTLDTSLMVDDVGRTFAAMQRANLNVYQFDPRGLEVGRKVSENFGLFAENTGGRAVTNTNAPWEGVPQVFRENSSYYLLGFRPADARQDGRFRSVSVQVSRPGVEVRTRAGYYAPIAEEEGSTSDGPQPTAIERALAGGLPSGDLPLTLNVVPVPVSGRKEAAVAVIVGLGSASDAEAPARDVVELVATAFTDTWKEAGTAAQRIEITKPRPDGAAAYADVSSRLDLEPGRYEVRVAVQSSGTGRTGSVFASLTVPDYAKRPLGLGGVLVARGSADDVTRTPMTAGSPGSPAQPWPASITAARSFGRADAITAIVPISQAGRRQPVTVQLTTRVVDDEDREVFSGEFTIDAATFGPGALTLFQFQLPLAALTPGRYLLSFEATTGSDDARASVPFRVDATP